MNPALFLSLALFVVLSSAMKLTLKKIHTHQPLLRRAPAPPAGLQVAVDGVDAENSFDINSVHDLIYIADITIAGVDYPVQLDTGSSDLFIKPETVPLPNAKTTDLTFNLTYAIGWASGNIAYAPVEFVDIKVPNQAFIAATAVENPALSHGALGIAGLGFNKLSSLDLLINRTQSDEGRSLLHNLFAANPDEQNFMAFALQRSLQPDGDVEGSFSIGELEPQYAHISGSERIPTWPRHNPFRWNVLLDALIVGSEITVPFTKVSGAPSNKAVVLMDSGSSYTYAPKEMCDAIYGGVAGAAFDEALGYWRVPCDAEVNMALQIGGQLVPVHPLDINPTTTVKNVCIGSFVPQAFSIGNDFDWLIGDNVLRSVYSLYDFGDFDDKGVMGDPYMKLLSLVDPDEASIEFHQLRGGTPKTNITFTGLDGISIAPSFSISTDISESLELIGKFVPAMLGIVALNALILIVACIVWIVSMCRKRGSGGRGSPRRTARDRMSPMPMNTRNSYVAGISPPPSPHSYERVSTKGDPIATPTRRSSSHTLPTNTYVASPPTPTAPQIYQPNVSLDSNASTLEMSASTMPMAMNPRLSYVPENHSDSPMPIPRTSPSPTPLVDAPGIAMNRSSYIPNLPQPPAIANVRHSHVPVALSDVPTRNSFMAPNIPIPDSPMSAQTRMSYAPSPSSDSASARRASTVQGPEMTPRRMSTMPSPEPPSTPTIVETPPPDSGEGPPPIPPRASRMRTGPPMPLHLRNSYYSGMSPTSGATAAFHTPNSLHTAQQSLQSMSVGMSPGQAGEDEPFIPPAPAFLRQNSGSGGDRPRSVA